MDKNLIYQLIAEEISKASRNKRTQVIHLQMLKYADQLEYVTARDFCDGVGLPQSFSCSDDILRPSHLRGCADVVYG